MRKILAPLFVVCSLLVSSTLWGQFDASFDPSGRTRGDTGAVSNFGWDFGGSGYTPPTSRLLNPNSQQNWVLGVYVDNTETGVVVQRIEPRSAAERSGIEVGDVIVSVGGFQVGYVDGRLYDVADEFRRRVSDKGQVSMLVLDRRTQRLEKVQVGLQSTSVALRGEVIWRDRKQLPINSVLQVRLVNVTRPNFEVRGGSQIQTIVRQQPIPWELYVDPNYVSVGDRYQLQAAITSGSQTLYYLSQPVMVDLSSGQSEQYFDLEMVGVGNNVTGASYTVGYPPSAQEVIALYQRYLQRAPQERELTAWLDHLARGRSINDLPPTLLNSTEFFDRSGGTNGGFVNRMFQTAAGRAPSQEELSRWVLQIQRLGGGGKSQVIRDFLQAVQGR